MDKKNGELWFLTGSQHLYGEETLQAVARESKEIVAAINASGKLPFEVRWVPTITRDSEAASTCLAAQADGECKGIIAWMHTFSPAKMWINGLKILSKPLLHLHTQYYRDIPWQTIDMDYMNLHQSAHGDREFGHICARLGVRRSVMAGHWSEIGLLDRMAVWARAALAVADLNGAKFARFGDNMREVAVTEGDKVSAQIALGVSVNGYGIGELSARVAKVGAPEIEKLMASYREEYEIPKGLWEDEAQRAKVAEQARIELALEGFLVEGGFKGFTTTFEDLVGMRQLPGLAAQRMMAKGYGFGAEGDWKQAVMVRAMKAMARGLGGVSFMEDYTYHLEPGREMVLGAHMLELCPSVASAKPRLEVHPLSIGGKEDPARLVFSVAPGRAVNAALVDMGYAMRLVWNEVDVLSQEQAMPKLPVARALWRPKPDFSGGLEAWIMAGGGHHTGFSQALRGEHIAEFANMLGIEEVGIGEGTDVKALKRELSRSEADHRGRV